MPSTPASTLICTLGTSLFRPNLAGLKADDPDPSRRALAAAFAARDPERIAEELLAVDPLQRLCGAEINSNTLLIGRGAVVDRPNLFLCHSATDDGRVIARTLAVYYRASGLESVHCREIDDLQDSDPQAFRTRGLRNLAKTVCRIIREYQPAHCALNATGGYKAQIAVAVLMGQALGVPIYYKHELFNEIIAFPPMPVALDFDLWLKLGPVLFALDREGILPASEVYEDLAASREQLESLVDSITERGRVHLSLSATGQIFHETFRERFRAARSHVLPPPVPPDQKKEPHIEDGHTRDIRGIRPFLVDLTREVPQVARCLTTYSNPDLPRASKFWVGAEGLVGQYGDGTALARFRVETSAQNRDQEAAVAALLNEWLASRS
jgi:putative CRISPR-associated protein (TIGR02619 family)